MVWETTRLRIKKGDATMVRLAQIVAARSFPRLTHWFGAIATTKNRRRRHSALDLATLDMWWCVWDDVQR